MTRPRPPPRSPGDELGQQQRVAGGAGSQRQQARIWHRAERIGDHFGYRVVAERLQADAGGTFALEQVEQQLGVVIPVRGTPGQDPGQRIRRELPGQGTERVQGGRVGPVQIVQADQKRADRGPLLELRPQELDEP